MHLVEPHTDKTREKSVYDFIPIDPDTGFPSVSNDNVSLCKHYFEVKTEVLSADATKLNIYDRASVGNEYDVLIRKSRPYRSMSETSNYSHLGDITCSVTAEENSRGHETIATNHVYAILVPCDSEHFHYIEEERNATYTTIRQAIP